MYDDAFDMIDDIVIAWGQQTIIIAIKHQQTSSTD